MTIPRNARSAADEEARAEVEVLNSRLEKTNQLTKKIQASLTRLETSGRSVDDAIGPIYSNTQRLQLMGSNIDGILAMIDKFRQPSGIQNSEESVIREGVEGAGLSAYLASMTRLNEGLMDLKATNLRSNQAAVSDMTKLLSYGKQRLERYFHQILAEDSVPVEPLHFITKSMPFPLLKEANTMRLGPVNSFITSMASGDGEDGSTARVYASIRGPYLAKSLENLASATLNMAKRKAPGEIYKSGSNGVSMYGTAMEGMFRAEYDNICALYPRDDWGTVLEMTTQRSFTDLSKTLQELNVHIKSHLMNDCFLAFETMDVITNLANSVEARTGELKPSFSSALKPIRDTAKSAVGEMLEDTRRRVLQAQMLTHDGSAFGATRDIMTRMQSMVGFLRPMSMIMISLGDGNWKNTHATTGSSDMVPSLSSFDVTADGKQIFGHYCADTIDALMSAYDARSRVLMKNKSSMGVFIGNNISVIERMILDSELKKLLADRMNVIDVWRKKATSLYLDAWKDPSAQLLDVQYTNRGARPPSGSAAHVDSAAIVKGLGSKDKDAIKEKFRSFNTSFDELVARHKALSMERDVREMLAKQVQQMMEPLYGRFWDRYHEIDKGKGKYVRYDKTAMAAIFTSLA